MKVSLGSSAGLSYAGEQKPGSDSHQQADCVLGVVSFLRR